MTAIRLQCNLDQLSELAALSDSTIPLGSTCVVFAESEIIGFWQKDTALPILPEP
jgi:activator of 2-hydroxyglutaryl-CoA dehydratase